MGELILAAAFFVGTHLGIASTSLRPALAERLGEGPYRLVYSVLAVVAITWLVVAWRAAPYAALWPAGAALRHLVLATMPLAILLVVAGLTQRNPTAVGVRPDPDAGDAATGILRVTRHPFLWGTGVWAVLHMLGNGDLASLVFFGSIAVTAFIGTGLIDARRTREGAPGWGVFLQGTSNVPLVAILQRRQRLSLREIGLGRLAAALGLYVALLYFHPWLFGVSVLP